MRAGKNPDQRASISLCTKLSAGSSSDYVLMRRTTEQSRMSWRTDQMRPVRVIALDTLEVSAQTPTSS